MLITFVALKPLKKGGLGRPPLIVSHRLREGVNIIRRMVRVTIILIVSRLNNAADTNANISTTGRATKKMSNFAFSIPLSPNVGGDVLSAGTGDIESSLLSDFRHIPSL